ncbi:PTS transporter subunit EIIC [Paenibacillus thiaminolyticus]|uniref:PTS transporter subunit EIIC n=1 Tax=Paenibacillus thiaminolyticus TaxID=49283 RepID=UPI00233059C1|nr:PTS transporter subunit EIIC [Paenibacillus thiaminolyticus]WCF06700.1 PTS transporter subunit EIIC [Paenibacillus thiaminolyticus]
MNYRSFAKDVVKLLGGKQNISSLVHCATRLRFNLHDPAKTDKPAIEKLEGVLGVVESGGQFQVIVGKHVEDAYKEIEKMISSIETADETAEPVDETKPSLGNRIFEVISRSFSPLLGALAGAGMLKALLTVLTMVGWLSTESGTYFILSAAGNAVFYFLPIFLGITLATKLGANPYVGGAIGAALLEPNFAGLLENIGDRSDFLGIPVLLMDYSSSVFPVFIAVCIYAALNNLLKKIIHRDLHLFMLPLLSLLIIVPLTVLIFGPFGIYVGDAIGAAIGFLSSKSGILTGAVMGAGWTFLTLFGLHWGVVPIMISNIGSGGDPLTGMLAAAPFAQMGVALGIFLKAKDKNLKTLGGSTLLPGLLSGVTEPIIYGLMVRFKRTIIYVVIAGAVGGAINGFFGAKATAFGFPSVLTIPVFTPMGLYVIGVAAAFVGAALLTVFLGYEDKIKKG